MLKKNHELYAQQVPFALSIQFLYQRINLFKLLPAMCIHIHIVMQHCALHCFTQSTCSVFIVCA